MRSTRTNTGRGLAAGLLLAVPASLAVASCNMVIGISDVQPGTVCQTDADCNSTGTVGPADPCLMGKCTNGICDGVQPINEGTSCGLHGESCTQGTCSCPVTNQCGDGGECIDITSSRDHCGECGHSCDDQKCFEGLCEPLVIEEEPDDEGSFTTITEDANFIYISAYNYIDPDPSAVRSIAKSDNTVTTLASLDHSACFYGAVPLGGRLYFSNACYDGSVDPAFTYSGDMLSASILGGDLQVVVDGPYGTGLQNLGNDLYYETNDGLDMGTSKLQRFTLPAGPLVDLVPSKAAAFRLTPSIMYYVTEGQLIAYPLAPMNGEMPVVLATGIGKRDGDPPYYPISDLLVDASYAYVFVRPTQTEIDEEVPNGSLLRVPLSGGEPEVLVSGLLEPSGFAIDDRHVYFGDAGKRRLWRLPLGAPAMTPPTPFANFAPTAMLVSDKYAYLGDDRHSTVVRIAK